VGEGIHKRLVYEKAQRSTQALSFTHHPPRRRRVGEGL